MFWEPGAGWETAELKEGSDMKTLTLEERGMTVSIVPNLLQLYYHDKVHDEFQEQSPLTDAYRLLHLR